MQVHLRDADPGCRTIRLSGLSRSKTKAGFGVSGSWSRHMCGSRNPGGVISNNNGTLRYLQRSWFLVRMGERNGLPQWTRGWRRSQSKWLFDHCWIWNCSIRVVNKFLSMAWNYRLRKSGQVISKFPFSSSKLPESDNGGKITNHDDTCMVLVYVMETV